MPGNFISALKTDSDENLVARVRTGDTAAFEQIFRAHYESLCSFARRYTGSTDSARDIVQDALLRLWRQRESWFLKSTLRGYLFTVVRNLALNELDKRNSEARGSEKSVQAHDVNPQWAPAMGAASPLASDLLEDEERRSAVRKAISELPERMRLAAILRWEHGMTYAEVAGVMGISVKGVEAQLARAVKELTSKLEEYLL